MKPLHLRDVRHYPNEWHPRGCRDPVYRSGAAGVGGGADRGLLRDRDCWVAQHSWSKLHDHRLTPTYECTCLGASSEARMHRLSARSMSKRCNTAARAGPPIGTLRCAYSTYDYDRRPKLSPFAATDASYRHPTQSHETAIQGFEVELGLRGHRREHGPGRHVEVLPGIGLVHRDKCARIAVKPRTPHQRVGTELSGVAGGTTHGGKDSRRSRAAGRPCRMFVQEVPGGYVALRLEMMGSPRALSAAGQLGVAWQLRCWSLGCFGKRCGLRLLRHGSSGQPVG